MEEKGTEFSLKDYGFSRPLDINSTSAYDDYYAKIHRLVEAEPNVTIDVLSAKIDELNMKLDNVMTILEELRVHTICCTSSMEDECLADIV